MDSFLINISFPFKTSWTSDHHHILSESPANQFIECFSDREGELIALALLFQQLSERSGLGCSLVMIVFILVVFIYCFSTKIEM